MKKNKPKPPPVRVLNFGKGILGEPINEIKKTKAMDSAIAEGIAEIRITSLVLCMIVCMFVGGALMYWVGVDYLEIDIESEIIITPGLIIEESNGVADTSYVYKFN